MYRRVKLLSRLAVAGVALFFSPALHGQLPARLERCLPYPTFAEEIKQENAAREAEAAPAPKIVIDAIQFDDKSDLSIPLREVVIDAIRQGHFEDWPGWTDEVAEVGMRATLQARGYFRAYASASAQTLSKDAQYEHVSLTLHVEPGPRYWLGTVQFRSSDPDKPLVFSEAELRSRLPLRDGDIFDVSKLREAFDALKRLYGSAGWVDFTPEVSFNVDEAHGRLDLMIQLDQGPRYRIGQIEILGNNPAAEKVLRSELKTGEPFNAFVLTKFYDENKSILPPDASAKDDVQVKKDVRSGIANLQFDFRTCPAVSE